MENKEIMKGSGKKRREHKDELQKKRDEQSMLHKSLYEKWKEAAMNRESDPKVVAQLGVQVHNELIKLQEFELQIDEINRIIAKCETEENYKAADKVFDRNLLGGKLNCGINVVSIRPSNSVVASDLKEYKDIVKDIRNQKAIKQSQMIEKAIDAQVKNLQTKK
jgi:hypothetical protein